MDHVEIAVAAWMVMAAEACYNIMVITKNR